MKEGLKGKEDNSELSEKIKMYDELCLSLDLKEKEVYENAQKELESLFLNNMKNNTDTNTSASTNEEEEPAFEPKIEEID